MAFKPIGTEFDRSLEVGKAGLPPLGFRLRHVTFNQRLRRIQRRDK